MFSRFYTYPPVECEWKWVLRNIKQVPQENAVHEIVDIGIYDLLKPPYHYSEERLEKWKELKTEGWKVVPDFPDISNEFNIDPFRELFDTLPVTPTTIKTFNFLRNNVIDSTRYSWELLTTLYDPTDEHQLPVIQSSYGDLNSLKRYCNDFREKYGEPEKIAIGSVCKLNNVKKSTELIKECRNQFPNAWIHVFGLRLNHLRHVYKYIDSYDSTAWTFPRQSGRPSCRNYKERIQYFWEYIDRVNEILRNEGVNV